MDIVSATPPPTTPSTLAELAGEIRAAREEVDARRLAPVDWPSLLSARQTLLGAMEVYARELTARRLPLPRQLRDDLRLQRGIRRQPQASGWHRHDGA
ncbi:hypothetical protein [Phycicoccus sp. SLBN-51]|uniref:hypothetical protein n=1 Tax=Phycicoccus sp. SLBN-51 TaxID=2768447 RepID=UPI00114D5269|nr:hypothetical protein [Phycicoccus sp. SLBN-51]